MIKLLIQISIIMPFTTDSPWSLSADGQKGLQSILKRKQQDTTETMAGVKTKYLHTLTGGEVNFLDGLSDFSDSDSEFSDS